VETASARRLDECAQPNLSECIAQRERDLRQRGKRATIVWIEIEEEKFGNVERPVA